MSIFRELKRRNVFKVAIAYAIVAWLLIEVTATTFPMLRLPDWTATFVTVLMILGFPLALIFAWAFEITPEGIKRERDVDRSQSITHLTGRSIDYIIIAALSVALVFFAFTHDWGGEEVQDAEVAASTAEKSIVVLPFVNMSDDPANEYFSDGISEELRSILAKVDGLKVTPRTSSSIFVGKDTSISEIAEKLKVDHVLEGSVRKAGNKVRITAQLIEARTDKHLWSATYDRELEDIFAIQDEISGQIVQALKIALRAGEQEAMSHAQKPTDNLEAYELYLRGRYFWQRRGEDNIRHAIDLFEQATKLDPQFAQAWSSLAAAQFTLPGWSDAPRDRHYPVAVSAARRALALNDSLAEAYGVLGVMAVMDRKWAEAKAHYLSAIASEPKNSTAHVWYGEHLVSVGRIRDALEETLIGHQLDPLHPNTNGVLAWIYLMLDDTDNMLKYGAAAWDLGHSSGLRIQALAHLRLAEFDRASELAEQYDQIYPHMTIRKLFIEAKMDAVKRPLFLEKLAQNELALSFRFSVASYAGFGLIDDAYRVARQLLDNDSADPDNSWWVLWRPEMATFRQDPRFAGLVTDLGLMDYWREYGWPDACQPTGDSLICE